jgi:hypothetical protein
MVNAPGESGESIYDILEKSNVEHPGRGCGLLLTAVTTNAIGALPVFTRRSSSSQSNNLSSSSPEWLDTYSWVDHSPLEQRSFYVLTWSTSSQTGKGPMNKANSSANKPGTTDDTGVLHSLQADMTDTNTPELQALFEFLCHRRVPSPVLRL